MRRMFGANENCKPNGGWKRNENLERNCQKYSTQYAGVARVNILYIFEMHKRFMNGSIQIEKKTTFSITYQQFYIWIKWTMIGNESIFKWNECQSVCTYDAYICLTFRVMFICCWHDYNESESSIESVAIYNKHAKWMPHATDALHLNATVLMHQHERISLSICRSVFAAKWVKLRFSNARTMHRPLCAVQCIGLGYHFAWSTIANETKILLWLLL